MGVSPADTRRNNTAMITSNDVATSFWRDVDVITGSCVRWVASGTKAESTGMCTCRYRETCNISGTLVDNKIVDHWDVVGASPVSPVPTTSSFSTPDFYGLGKTSARQDEKHISFGIRFVVTYIRGFTVLCKLSSYPIHTWDVSMPSIPSIALDTCSKQSGVIYLDISYWKGTVFLLSLLAFANNSQGFSPLLALKYKIELCWTNMNTWWAAWAVSDD